MSDRPLLYDVFSGAGGAAAGYVRAGFRVIGIDNRPQPRYLLSGAAEFIQMDAFEFFERVQRGEYPMPAAWHCSPPCQGYSRMRHLPWLKDREVIHPGSMLGSRYSKHSAGVAGVLPSARLHEEEDPLTTASRAMGIDWMTADELAEAIPPAYTHWIGAQLMHVLQAETEQAA